MKLEDKTVLVTGGAGFIGSYVTRQITSAGADVEVVDNCFTGKPSFLPDEVALHNVDLRNQNETSDIVKVVDPDVLIHLAAIHFIPYCNENPEEAFNVNVLGTRNLLEACRDVDGIERVVNASTAAIYEPARGPHVEDEGIGPTDIYGRSKLVAEDEARLFAADTDIPTTSARLFNTYGQRETNMHLIPAILEQIEDGSRTIELGNLKPARDFIHASDVARAIYTLASDFEGDYRAYNVGSGTEHTVKEVVAAIETAIDDKITIDQDEERVRETDRPHLEADISRLEEEYAWSPQMELEEGLRDLLNDYT